MAVHDRRCPHQTSPPIPRKSGPFPLLQLRLRYEITEEARQPFFHHQQPAINLTREQLRPQGRQQAAAAFDLYFDGQPTPPLVTFTAREDHACSAKNGPPGYWNQISPTTPTCDPMTRNRSRVPVVFWTFCIC
jgi:hypothetical protein